MIPVAWLLGSGGGDGGVDDGMMARYGARLYEMGNSSSERRKLKMVPRR